MPPSPKGHHANGHHCCTKTPYNRTSRPSTKKPGPDLTMQKTTSPPLKGAASPPSPKGDPPPVSRKSFCEHTRDQKKRIANVLGSGMAACVEPHDVWCLLCWLVIRLDSRSEYQFSNWDRHTRRCQLKFIEKTRKRLCCTAKEAVEYRSKVLKERKSTWSKEIAIAVILEEGTGRDRGHLLERRLITLEQAAGKSIPSGRGAGKLSSTTPEEPPCRQRKLLHVNTENVDVFQYGAVSVGPDSKIHAVDQQGATESRCPLKSTPPRLVRITNNLREEKATSEIDELAENNKAESSKTGLSTSELTKEQVAMIPYQLRAVSSWDGDDDDPYASTGA